MRHPSRGCLRGLRASSPRVREARVSPGSPRGRPGDPIRTRPGALHRSVLRWGPLVGRPCGRWSSTRKTTTRSPTRLGVAARMRARPSRSRRRVRSHVRTVPILGRVTWRRSGSTRRVPVLKGQRSGSRPLRSGLGKLTRRPSGGTDGDPGVAPPGAGRVQGRVGAVLDQDRSRRDQLLIRRGLAVQGRAERLLGPPGPCTLQAASWPVTIAPHHRGDGLAPGCRLLRGALPGGAFTGGGSEPGGGDGVQPRAGLGRRTRSPWSRHGASTPSCPASGVTPRSGWAGTEAAAEHERTAGLTRNRQERALLLERAAGARARAERARCLARGSCGRRGSCGQDRRHHRQRRPGGGARRAPVDPRAERDCSLGAVAGQTSSHRGTARWGSWGWT